MSNFTRNPLVYLVSAVWHYSKGNTLRVAAFWLMFIVAESIFLFGQPLIVAKILNTVQRDGITAENIRMCMVLLVCMFMLEVAFWLFHGPARVLEEVNAFNVRTNYRRHLLRGIMTLPLDWHFEHHSGDTIDKVSKGTGGIYEFSKESFVIVYSIVRLVVSYVMLTIFSPPAGVIVAIMILLTLLVTIRFDRGLNAQYEEITHAENAISESISDGMNNILTVIILRVEKLVFDGIMHKVEKPLDLVRRYTKTNEWKWFCTSMCCAVMTGLVLVTYLWQNLGTPQGVLVGSFYILVQYLGKMSEVFYQFTTMYGGVLRRRVQVANAEELSRDFGSETFANHGLPSAWKTLGIQNLSFAYGSGDARVHLDDASLIIERGERIALVGGSGSGKTTFLKVMRDLHHPRNLTLSVDGHVIHDGFAGISRAITLVPQASEIFARTVWENITLGAEHDITLVRRFTDMACFTEVAESLPHGFDSSLQEKGVNLSGGQQQRLALARGLLACHGKDIILLDEPTSSLDAVTEMEVYQRILKGFPEQTIISSVHGLYLLPLFDRICMFEDGKIIATGTLDEMLASCPQFATLWNTQKEATKQ